MKLLFFAIIIAKVTLANEVNDPDLESLGLDDVRPFIVDNRGEKDSNSANDQKTATKNSVTNSKKTADTTNSNYYEDFSKKTREEGSKFKEFFSNKSKDIKKNINKVTNKISNSLNNLSKEGDNNENDDIIKNASNIITSKNNQIQNENLPSEKEVAILDDNHKYQFNKLYPKPISKIPPDFLTTDIPPPLLSRSFSDENIHHPILNTYSDKVDLLFTEIGANDINDFNAILRDVLNVNIYNDFGDTPLIFAVSLKRRSIASSLVSAGANPDLKNGLGLTAVNIAIKMGDYEMVKLLIESGANLNVRNNFGETYLMQAVRMGYLPVIDYLVAKDIDLDATNKQNLTAFDIAIQSKNNVVVQLLLKYGTKRRLLVNRSIIDELDGKWGYRKEPLKN